MNSFFFEEDPRFTRLKPSLALRLLSKGLFYIRAMVLPDIFVIVVHFLLDNCPMQTVLKNGVQI